MTKKIRAWKAVSHEIMWIIFNFQPNKWYRSATDKWTCISYVVYVHNLPSVSESCMLYEEHFVLDNVIFELQVPQSWALPKGWITARTTYVTFALALCSCKKKHKTVWHFERKQYLILSNKMVYSGNLATRPMTSSLIFGSVCVMLFHASCLPPGQHR